eukprot:5596948-Ditylum_brightwellii.AAC.1
MDWEEILEVLENMIPIAWTFQMDKEGFDVSSLELSNNSLKCECATKNVNQPHLKQKFQLAKAPWKRKERAKQIARHNTEECNISMVCSKGHMRHENEEGSYDSKKIAKALSCHKKKEKDTVSNIEALLISSGSNNGNSDIKSKVSHTSDEVSGST